MSPSRQTSQDVSGSEDRPSASYVIKWRARVPLDDWQRATVEMALRDAWRYMSLSTCTVTVHWRSYADKLEDAMGFYELTNESITIAWENIQYCGYSQYTQEACLYETAAHEGVHRAQHAMLLHAWPILKNDSATDTYCE